MWSLLHLLAVLNYAQANMDEEKWGKEERCIWFLRDNILSLCARARVRARFIPTSVWRPERWHIMDGWIACKHERHLVIKLSQKH